MKALDPRFKGTASKGDPMFSGPVVVKPDGYKRTKAQTKREDHRNDPYFREPDFTAFNRGIV